MSECEKNSIVKITEYFKLEILFWIERKKKEEKKLVCHLNFHSFIESVVLCMEKKEKEKPDCVIFMELITTTISKKRQRDTKLLSFIVPTWMFTFTSNDTRYIIWAWINPVRFQCVKFINITQTKTDNKQFYAINSEAKWIRCCRPNIPLPLLSYIEYENHNSNNNK